MIRSENEQGYMYYIGWNHQGAEAYLFGTSLSICEDGWISMKNPLIPAGTALMTWYSEVNYQAKRIEPDLPPLQEEKEYIFRSIYRTKDKSTVMFRISFYDRQHEHLEDRIFREETEHFRLPEGTYSYTIQMIQAGVDELEFHHLEIFSEEQRIYGLQNPDPKVRKWNVVILEPYGHCAPVPSKRLLRHLPNTVVIPHLMMRKHDWQAELLSILENDQEKADKLPVKFWGYGPESSKAAKEAVAAWRYGKAEMAVFTEPVEKHKGQTANGEAEHVIIPMLVRKTEHLQDMMENEGKAKKVRKISK